MKAEFGRGELAGFICLSIFGVLAMFGATISVINLIMSMTNGFNYVNFGFNLIAVLCFACLIVYGFYSYKKGFNWFRAVMGAFAFLILANAFLFKPEINDDSGWIYRIIGLLSALSYGAICMLFNYFGKDRKKSLPFLFVIPAVEVAVSIIFLATLKVDAGVTDIVKLLLYADCLVRPCIAICMTASFYVAGTKKYIQTEAEEAEANGEK